MFGFKAEPALIAGAIRAVILCAVSFGLKWTGEQVASLMLAVEAVLTLVLRQSVVSQNTLEKSGTTVKEVVAKAESNEAARR